MIMRGTIRACLALSIISVKDYHLILSASSGTTQKSDMYFVRGHFYIGQAGQFMDLGAMGKQMAAAMLPMIGAGRDVHYVGRVTTGGRPAYRFTVQYRVDVPVAGGLTGAAEYFSNTVDVDVATRAPLRVIGAYHGDDGKGHKATLNTSFLVTRVGKVGAIRVP
jgi:hypothetical protein